jgi:hypothetical protein
MIKIIARFWLIGYSKSGNIRKESDRNEKENYQD